MIGSSPAKSEAYSFIDIRATPERRWDASSSAGSGNPYSLVEPPYALVIHNHQGRLATYAILPGQGMLAVATRRSLIDSGRVAKGLYKPLDATCICVVQFRNAAGWMAHAGDAQAA